MKCQYANFSAGNSNISSKNSTYDETVIRFNNFYQKLSTYLLKKDISILFFKLWLSVTFLAINSTFL